MTAARLLIWTRGLSDWPADAKLLAAGGLPYQHIPCVRLSPLELTETKRQMLMKPPTRQAFVFTSAHAVHFAMTHPEFKAALAASDILIYAVGEATRASLAVLGLTARVPPQAQGGEELAAHLVKQAKAEPLTYILAGPQQRAYDLQAALARASLHSVQVDLYRTDEGLYAGAGGEELRGASKQSFLKERRGGLVCFASPSAVRGFCAELDRELLAGHFFPVCIGTTTAKACEPYFDQLAIARQPSLRELLTSAREVYDVLTFDDDSPTY